LFFFPFYHIFSKSKIVDLGAAGYCTGCPETDTIKPKISNLVLQKTFSPSSTSWLNNSVGQVYVLIGGGGGCLKTAKFWEGFKQMRMNL
jgi:hypothetical protein